MEFENGSQICADAVVLSGQVTVNESLLTGETDAICLLYTSFLVSNKYFRTIIIGSDVWKGMGYNTVLLLAAITNVDPTLYEAAQVDGAGRWKQVLHVTLPCILPMVAVLTVLGLGNILNAGFEQILIMYNPTVEKTVDILDTLVYRLGMTSHQYSAAAAMGLFKSVISLIFVGTSYLILYKKSDYRVF